MKPAIFISMLLLAACSAPQSTTQNTDSTSAKSSDSTQSANTDQGDRTLCFLHLDGTKGQDTSYIRLELQKEQVSGIYDHIPFEKDSRKGTLTGSIKNDVITGTWHFMQEGMQDSLPVKFKLSHDMLYQQAYGFDTKTGRQTLSDTSKFSIEYQKTNCR